MADQQITCSDCGDAFVFTQAEQSFYAEKGLTTAPKRCKACRAARKTTQGDRGSGERGGNRFSPSNGRSGGGSEGGWRPRAQAGTRGPAGQSPRPPGASRWNQGAPSPRADAPRPRVEEVQSRAPRDGFNARRHEGRPPASRPVEPTREKAAPRERAPKPKFDITCAECGTTAQVPFKPLEGRQVFCQPCYRARKGTTETAVAGVEIADTDSGIVE